MSGAEATAARQRLLARRERLAGAAADRPSTEIAELLRHVDAALGRIERSEPPCCRECGGAIEPEVLDVAAEVRICLECMEATERHALERDLEGAARVQRALLPPPRLDHAGWEVAWTWEPHGAVSGDHVDVLAPAADQLASPLHLLLGDVAGKGVAASLLQSQLHALFRALTHETIPLGELLGHVNRLFSRVTGPSRYATFIAGRLTAGGTAELANAGHPRPLLADRRGVRPIEGAGLPLGLFGDSDYVTSCVALAPGDVLLLYSDGLTEAARGEEEYGIGRAAAALQRAADQPLPELLAACRRELDAFLDGARRGDDLTLLAVRRTG